MIQVVLHLQIQSDSLSVLTSVLLLEILGLWLGMIGIYSNSALI
jgi:spore maturation protein SpmA